MDAQLRRLGPNSKIEYLRAPEDLKPKIWLAGRGTSCQIYTKSIYASRKHFSITYKEGKYLIADLQSINGTFVDDEKLIGEKVLKFGNVISVGVPSAMHKEPDSVVFVFELHSDDNTGNKESGIIKDDEVLIVNEVYKNVDSVNVCDVNITKSKKNHEISNMKSSSLQSNTAVMNVIHGVEKKCSETEKTVLICLPNNIIPDEVVLVEGSGKKLRCLSTDGTKPAKRLKLDEKIPVESGLKSEVVKEIESEIDERADTKSDLICGDNDRKLIDLNLDIEEDIIAYEALTQVDEPKVKVESNLLNYSLTEELIEISDSEEEDWISSSINLKNTDGQSFNEVECDEEDDDDDVTFIKTITKQKNIVSCDCNLLLGNSKIEDDLTETDRKWMEKLLKLKQENNLFDEVGDKRESTCTQEVDTVIDDTAEFIAQSGDVGEGSPTPLESLSVPDGVKSSTLLTNVIQCQKSISTVKTLTDTKISEEAVQRIKKKTVRFTLVPQIRYFEVPARPILTPAEKGKLQFMKTIFNICNWNTHWLEECKRVAPGKDPLDICDLPLRKIPRKFSSHADYMGAFIPVMLLQLWNKVKENWVTSGDVSFRMTVSCDSYENYHTENLSVCKCAGIVQSVKGHRGLLREGHLVLLRLHQIPDAPYRKPASRKYSKKLGYLVFGFVENKVYERFHGQQVHPALAERCSTITGDLHIVRLTILVKKRPNFELDKEKLIQLTVVQHISQEIRMFRGICFLSESPLCRPILKPTKAHFPLVSSADITEIIFKGPLDDSQREIVSKLSQTCSSTDYLLYSIHGAAGTGKSQVVLAFVLQLLYGEEWKEYKKPKILYCTRSSSSLDEMVCRLKSCRETLDGRTKFRMIRVGQVADVKPEVADVSLSNVATVHLSLDKECKAGSLLETEIRVLEEADIICATCSSTGMTKVTSAFEKVSARKIICIIDEAMSVREAESVIPLLLGVTHLVLVGDIYQLEPPFSGERTHSLGSDMSLFWRIHRNFTSFPRNSWPMYILKTQYRINSLLPEFIGKLIYNTPLVFPPKNGATKISGLRSFLFLVDRTSTDMQSLEKRNREGRLVVQLVRTITKVMRGSVKREVLRFGVISSDERQNESLQTFLPKSKFLEVEVNDVEKFQGREVDVALFHYDGKKMFNSSVAVAVTRAKRSLFILASQQSIEVSSWFQKLSQEADRHSLLKYIHPNMSLEILQKIISA